VFCIVKAAFKVKGGLGYSSTKSSTSQSAIVETEINRKMSAVLLISAAKKSIIDFVGGVEYERKITDRFNLGTEFGFSLNNGYPFGSIIATVVL
jgi:hypothetical protein